MLRFPLRSSRRFGTLSKPLGALTAIAFCACIAGCSPSSDSTSDVDNQSTQNDLVEGEPSEKEPSEQSSGASPSVDTAGTDTPSAGETPNDSVATDRDAGLPDSATGFAMAPTAEENPTGRVLRKDMSPDDLIKYLQQADIDLQRVATRRGGIQSDQEAESAMCQLEQAKRQASTRLKTHPDATDEQRIDGIRGEMQSLSHLAAMGDLDAAKDLKAIAAENLQSEDSSIAMDSQIVLIGFEIDALGAGDEDAAQRLVSLVNDLGAHPKSDVPAILSMGQARQVLASYGYADLAGSVRDKILSLYGNSSDPMIASIAADAAGNERFDLAEAELIKLLQGDDVSVADWTKKAEELVDESPDIRAVQYLASAALRLEAAEHMDFVDATYRVLQERFTDPNAAATQEIQRAMAALAARKKVIGRTFDPDLPGVGGESIQIKDFRGKVILMPFWAISFPESLQIIEQVKQLRDAHPDQVTIVGMNLDPARAPLKEFVANAKLDFPSYQSISVDSDAVDNSVAARFGLVSLPFVAILDQDAKVAALDFTGTRIEPVVKSLIQESGETVETADEE